MQSLNGEVLAMSNDLFPINRSIIVVGIVRNCSNSIKNDLRVLDNAFKKFNLNYFLVESDSSDGSELKLEEICRSKSNFNFISLGNLKSTIPERIDRIAFCRNQYLAYLEKAASDRGFGYVVVADLDGINRELSFKAVESCFKIEGWDVCTANQNGPYYDIYALRATNWNMMDIDDDYLYFLEKFHLHFLAYFFSVIVKMFKRRGHHPIEVESAFGGIAVYKGMDIVNYRYDSRGVDGRVICEHVTLHKKLRENGKRIIVNPKFINNGWTVNSKRAIIKLVGLTILGKQYYRFR